MPKIAEMGKPPSRDEVEEIYGFKISDKAYEELREVADVHLRKSFETDFSKTTGGIDDHVWDPRANAVDRLLEALDDPAYVRALESQSASPDFHMSLEGFTGEGCAGVTTTPAELAGVDAKELRAMLLLVRELQQPGGQQSPQRRINMATMRRLYDWHVTIAGAKPTTGPASPFTRLMKLCVGVSRTTVMRMTKAG